MSQAIKTFDDLYREAETHDDYWVAGVVHQLTEEICARMEVRGINRAELARRLDVSPAYVTKILRGNANFTLASLVKIARALGAELRVGLETSSDEGEGEEAPRSVETRAPSQDSRAEVAR